MKRILTTFLFVALVPGSHFVALAELDTNSLPKVEEVLKRVLERARLEGRNDREFKQRYAFTQIKITETRNSRGKVRNREENRIENNPSPQALPVATNASSVESHGDTPAAGKELRQVPSGEVKGKAFEKSDFALSDDLLKRFRFTMVGQDTENGRAMMIVDFSPLSKDLPVRSFKDRFINKAAGRIWVDEEEAALVKIDLHLTESINVVGGLVGAINKCSYGFERNRTPEGLWFTTRVDWHLEGRQVFLSKTIDYHEERTDVRKAW
jgi:hypothetical protein